jgi:hypothetical protein
MSSQKSLLLYRSLGGYKLSLNGRSLRKQLAQQWDDEWKMFSVPWQILRRSPIGEEGAGPSSLLMHKFGFRSVRAGADNDWVESAPTYGFVLTHRSPAIDTRRLFPLGAVGRVIHPLARNARIHIFRAWTWRIRRPSPMRLAESCVVGICIHGISHRADWTEASLKHRG